MDKTELILTGTKYSVTAEMQVSCLCSSARKSFNQVNVFICLDWSSQLISASTSMFQTSVQHTFAISINCDTSDVSLLMEMAKVCCTDV